MTEDGPAIYVNTNSATLIQEQRRRSHLGIASRSGGPVFRAKAEPQQGGVGCTQDGAVALFSARRVLSPGIQDVRDREESTDSLVAAQGSQQGTWKVRRRGKLKARMACSACKQSVTFLHPDGDSQLICN